MKDLFNPVIPAFCAGLICVLGISYWLGRGEKKRLGNLPTDVKMQIDEHLVNGDSELKRPKLVWFNIILTIAAIVCLVKGILPLPAVFVVGLAIALIVNYPNVKIQQDRITAHGQAAILMISIIFAAGIFTGIMKGSGMIKDLAEALVSFIPHGIGGHLPVLTGITSMPASLLFDPDSYYFGVLPVLASAAEAFHVPGVEVARAAILGQMTTGFPVSPLTASTFLLIGLAGVDLGDHQKKTIPLAFLVTLVMVVVAVISGAIRL